MTEQLAADLIRQRIGALEEEHGVIILFAVESGSRAWGFPSPDSDYDVRFVYASPADDLLILWPKQRDVIEKMEPQPDLSGPLDLSGWRVDKAIRLLMNGNVALHEWLCSPIVYTAMRSVMDDFRALQRHAGEPRRCAFWHYRALMTSIIERYLKAKMISLKRYLYAIRPALAMIWLEQNSEGLPPMDMPSLLAQVVIPPDARSALTELLERKAKASEIGEGEHIPALDDVLTWARGLFYDGPRVDPSPEGWAQANEMHAACVRAARLAPVRRTLP